VKQNLTINDIWPHVIFSEINLDSSMIDLIILTNLIFLASKLGVHISDIFADSSGEIRISRRLGFSFSPGTPNI
jgi:hypothetical protein